MRHTARLGGAAAAGVTIVTFVAVVATAAVAAPSGRPAAGRHAAQLCVATSAAPPSCGPAQAELRSDGSLRVRVDDVVYHLALHSSQADVIVMHNIVQIDGFVASYEWVGATLQFRDDERRSRYEIRFAPPAR